MTPITRWRLRRTLGNWRWWVLLPVLIIGVLGALLLEWTEPLALGVGNLHHAMARKWVKFGKAVVRWGTKGLPPTPPDCS